MDFVFSQATRGLTSSAVREILKLTQGNSVISFAGGLPAEQFFPVQAMRDALNRVMDQGPRALQYGLTEGFTPLREQLCARMARKNMHVTPDHMLLTTGSQQSIDLLTRVLLDKDDVVLVEDPTYLAFLQVLGSAQAHPVKVDGDEHGMNLADLEAKIIKHKPKLVYVIPTFSNPTGRVWNLERRQGIVDLCRKHGVLIFEDDPYGEIKFDSGESFPSLFSLAGSPDDSHVVYTSTFSKTVAPAVRTGWVIGDKRIIGMMTRAKQAADLHSSTLDQQALYQLLCHFDLDAHITTIRDEYKRRMKLMYSLLSEHNIPGLTFSEPKGGMFFWVELPEFLDAEAVLKHAVTEGVAFVPGTPFFAQEPKRNTLRLNYTFADDDTMVRGMNTLANVFKHFLQTK
ncbi:aminotransferase-like domain-containing protein [Paenibacillus sp. y28]|uniref:aminotransferase-like domain-containing protein n=1 Tax=Paenibacillus sp. y28 TaxID=3129110 RepID=UPI003015A475